MSGQCGSRCVNALTQERGYAEPILTDIYELGDIL